MTDGILKIPHALLQCDSVPPPSSGEVYFPSSWIREGMWLFSPMEYSRSDAIRIARLHHKRENSFHSVCWNTYIWTPVSKACEESAYTEVVMLSGNQIKQRGHVQYLHHPSPGSRHVSEKTFRWFQPPAAESPQTSSLPHWGPRHHRAETNHPNCALSEFLTHRTSNYKKHGCLTISWGATVTEKTTYTAIVTGKTTKRLL